MISTQTVKELIKKSKNHLKIVAVAKLPTRFGNFQIIPFQDNQDKKEHAVIVKGDPCGKERVLVRIHSECLTGDTLGSLRCDCRDQLAQALKTLGRAKVGILLYLRQEGRGIGFSNKIKAYALQDFGFDTIEADKLLGFSGDERDYAVAAHILSLLNIKSIKLMTNNPTKLTDLKRHGVKVTERIPLITPPNDYNRQYLETKKKKSGHLLEYIETKLEQAEQAS